MDSSGHDASAGESVSVSSGGTWVLPRPAWFGDGVYGMRQRLMDAVLHPDFGPPPDWLPGALYRLWPTGGVRQGGGGGGVRGGENMSQYSGDDSHSMSGMQSPARSVASLSGKGGGGRSRHHYQAPKEALEPPFVYGKFNPGAYFGDVAMAFAGEGDAASKRLRPASVWPSLSA